MIDVEAQREQDAKLTDEEKRENVIRYAFGGNSERFEEFCRVLAERLPPETAVVIGGSSVTGHNYLEGAPFDAEGPGTSDLDLYMIGEAATQFFTLNGFWIPGIHSHPIKDGDEEIAPGLKEFRNELKRIAGREVTLQATQNFFYWFREKMLGQTYLTLVGELDEDEDAADNEL
ncbi:MAG TPA: hypothetical protein VL501_09340 [Pyrinomonadaceae bacterium]|nr:hypothetical protein [Pyrinomonadaceae bacterium]